MAPDSKITQVLVSVQYQPTLCIDPHFENFLQIAENTQSGYYNYMIPIFQRLLSSVGIVETCYTLINSFLALILQKNHISLGNSDLQSLY